MRKNVPIDQSLHERATKVAKSRGGMKLQAIGDQAFALWLDENETAPIKKASHGNARNRQK